MINSASYGSDLDLSTGENLFIDSFDFDQSKNQAFAKIHLGPKPKIVSMKLIQALKLISYPDQHSNP